MAHWLDIVVAGVPRPQGSKHARPVYRGSTARGTREFTGQAAQVDSSGDALHQWRRDITAAAVAAGATVLQGPVRVTIEFRMPRPQAHYLPANSRRSRPQLRQDAPAWHTSKPDVDKLTRAVLDALMRVVFADDAQVTAVRAFKVYAESPGARVMVDPLPQRQ